MVKWNGFRSGSPGKEGAQTFLIDLPVMILFGALFSIFVPNDRRMSPISSGFFWHGLLFTSIFNVAVVYAVIYYPDWMWMYFLEDSSNTTLELIFLFFFLYYLPYILGFYLGYDLKKQSTSLWLLFVLLMVASEGWLIYKLFDRYSVIGTNEQFFTNRGISLFAPDNPLGPVMNGSVGIMVVYYVTMLFRFKKHGRRSLSLG